MAKELINRRGHVGQWWLKYRRSFYRYMAALILWLAVLTGFAISLRTLNLTEGVVKEIKSGALTPRQSEREREVCEAAQAFAFQWLSFNGNDADYAQRMEGYGSFPAPAGEQTVNYIGVENMKEIDGCWRVEVGANLTRYITVTADDPRLPVNKIVRQYTENNRPMAVYTDQIRESYVISLRENASGLEIIGTPVLIAWTPTHACDLANIIDNEDYGSDFSIFIQQVVPMYFRGEDLANYLASGVSIKAAGGYETGKIKICQFEQKGNMARAAVSAELIDRGTVINQLLIIEARQEERRWLLTRLGGF